MSGAHVPAWKRLGLHLKRSSAVNDPPNADAATAVPSLKKRKLSDELPGDTKTTSFRQASHRVPNQEAKIPYSDAPLLNTSRQSSLKTTRPDTGSNDLEVVTNDVDIANTLTANGTNSSSTHQIKSKPLKKKKSVQFSADAKAVDGPEHPLDYSEVRGADLTERENPSSGSNGEEQVKERKKRQKKTTSLSDSNASVSADTPTASAEDSPYLIYLKTYDEDRGAWKFNKTKQTQLLQNVFNLYRIPSTYDSAISTYLQGLQGQAARLRLRKDAQKLLDEVEEEESRTTTADPAMEQPAARDAARDDALQTDVRKVKESMANADQKALEATPVWQHKLKKRARAEAVLRALAESDDKIQQSPKLPLKVDEKSPSKIVFADEPNGDQKRAATPKSTRKRSRGRKRRTLTGLPDDDDSSSSESSSDESTTSGANAKGPVKLRRVTANGSARADALANEQSDTNSETSSTTTASSSSGDSDSDSE